MMLGVSGLMGSSGDGAAAEGGGASGGSSEVQGASSSIPGEDSERSGGGNRWPRQETLALLKIRSDMDVAFRDSTLKGPLWDEVSRKMAELGFHRSAKKCKEKFENVYKYHKRTKDGRASKPDGKTYRFFDQLQALETSPPLPFTPPPPRTQPPPTTTMTAPPPPPPPNAAANFPMPSHVSTTVPSISPNPLSMLPPNTSIQTSHNPINNIIPPPFQPSMNASNLPFQSSHHILTSLLSDSSSSSTSSDEDIQRRRGKKRKWKDFFERLMKEVVQKQEELQKKFLETLEKRERDRMAREEAWRIQETARMNREHDLLVQERSIAAAKDAAVIAFLQKVSEQHNLQIPNITAATVQAVHPQVPPPRQVPAPPPPPPPPPPPQQSPLPLPLPPEPPALPVVTVASTKISKKDNGGSEGTFMPTSSSRWPKTEIEALIKLRTNLDLKYQENGPKGPLWEEISAGMSKMGYSRSSKRCKEKWENINKYYKKVKESSKKRPEDSKTCPYFHQLEALHREKNKNDNSSLNLDYTSAKQDNPMVPIMARPEQQWPNPHQDSTMHDQDQDNESENNEDDDDVDDEDEEDAGGYEIVTNKQPSSMTNTTE